MIDTVQRRKTKKTNNKSIWFEIKKNSPLIVMTIPCLIITFLICYLPMFGIIIAFKKVNMRDGILKSPWVGLENFKFLFNSSNGWLITRNTVGYNLIFIFIGLALAVTMAVLLNEITNKIFSKLYQTVLILPHFFSFVIVSYLAFAFLSAEYGYLNKYILPLFGVEPINWYINPKPWPLILPIVSFWKNTGYNSIIYTAAIAGIDMQLYEAAKIDGANKWQQICKITIPSLKPLMIIMTILNVGKIFSADFGLFYQVTLNSGALYPSTYVLNTYIYNMLTTAGTSSMGMASAASFYQSVVGLILVLTTNYIVKRIEPDSSLF